MKKAENVPVGTPEEVRIQEFLDMVAPSVIKFETDHFICGNTFRCVWALREYPTSTEEQAILKRLGEKDGVTLRIYTRHVNAAEERKIISNAASKNRMERANTNDLQQTVMAESNLQDVATIVAQTHRNREPLLHTAVYIELSASDYDRLKLLQTEVLTELIRSKLNVDRLMLRQQQGFQSVMPSGKNVFRDQFERVLPASSVANLYPFNYSGKTDPHGFYVGRDKFGSNVLVDFNQRAEDKTNGSILILGNSGQGKSYLLKLILCNLRESGMNVICLDPEMEYEDLTNNLQGCFIDLMGGRYIINPLEPKVWDEGDGPEDPDAPETFRISSRLSQHISFLKDFFRSYKDFTDREIDVIEIMLQKLYQSRGLSDQTDFKLLGPEDYPTLSEMYDFIEAEYKGFDEKERQLYTAELLQNILLGLHSMCKGAESKFFNGHTNITDSTFVTFGVKGLLQASKSLKNDDSRYHCLNLHSVFQKGTVEFRLFNGTVHAGKIKAYIQLCLAIGAQALNQSCASRRKTVTENEKYTFRTWLLRLGLIRDEFKTARGHLLEHLDGCIAWKDPAQALAQKERMRQKKEKEMAEVAERQAAAEGHTEEQEAGEESPTFTMSL